MWVSLVFGISMEISLYNMRWLVYVELVVWIHNWNRRDVTDGVDKEQDGHVCLCCVLSDSFCCRLRSYGCASTLTCHSVWCFCIVPRYDRNSIMPIPNLTKNKDMWEESGREVRVFNPCSVSHVPPFWQSTNHGKKINDCGNGLSIWLILSLFSCCVIWRSYYVR